MNKANPLKDICEALDIKNNSDVASRPVDTLGGTQQLTVITEAGLYEVLPLAHTAEN